MEPKHGETRGDAWRETRHSGERIYTNRETGEVVYRGPVTSTTRKVQERYCGKCHKWQQTAGLIGAMLCVECGHEWDTVPA